MSESDKRMLEQCIYHLIPGEVDSVTYLFVNLLLRGF